jgi:DNA-binding XRE family transcriptional regulator
MLSDMDIKLNTQLLKKLRDDRAWSQEQLATVSGLSLRTVQRIEADGNASLESRKAIASALDIDAAQLVESSQLAPASLTVSASIPRGHLIGMTLGLGGTLCGAAFAIYGIASSNGLSGAEAGISSGVVAALAGCSCAFIGTLSNHLRRQIA